MRYLIRAEVNDEPDYDAYVRSLFELARELDTSGQLDTFLSGAHVERVRPSEGTT